MPLDPFFVRRSGYGVDQWVCDAVVGSVSGPFRFRAVHEHVQDGFLVFLAERAFGAGGPSLVPFHDGGCGVRGPPALEQVALVRLGHLIALEDFAEYGLSLSLSHAHHVVRHTCLVQVVDGVLAKGGASVSLGCQGPSVLTE
eukprot:916660-Rhodomonas_salina.1